MGLSVPNRAQTLTKYPVKNNTRRRGESKQVKNSVVDWIFVLLQSWLKGRSSPLRGGEHPRLRKVRSPVSPRAHRLVSQTTQELLWAASVGDADGIGDVVPQAPSLRLCQLFSYI